MKQLPTGINDYPALIGNPKAKYVDKTALLYEMTNDVASTSIRRSATSTCPSSKRCEMLLAF